MIRTKKSKIEYVADERKSQIIGSVTMLFVKMEKNPLEDRAKSHRERLWFGKGNRGENAAVVCCN